MRTDRKTIGAIRNTQAAKGKVFKYTGVDKRVYVAEKTPVVVNRDDFVNDLDCVN